MGAGAARGSGAGRSCWEGFQLLIPNSKRDKKSCKRRKRAPKGAFKRTKIPLKGQNELQRSSKKTRSPRRRKSRISSPREARQVPYRYPGIFHTDPSLPWLLPSLQSALGGIPRIWGPGDSVIQRSRRNFLDFEALGTKCCRGNFPGFGALD